ncbi:MAG: hypothetical protein K6E42_08160, partial [Synergistes sp.]|nr:hypothetical protein [Synergistes sp.]
MAGDALRVAQVYVEFGEKGLAETEKGIESLGKKTDKTEKEVEALGKTADKTENEVESLGKTAGQTGKEVEFLGKTSGEANKGIGVLRKTTGEAERGIGSLKNTLSGVKTMLAGFVSYRILKSVSMGFIDAAKQAEDYRTSIRAVSSSVAEADATFQRVKDWAAVNPIDTDAAIGAFVRLKTAAVQNSEEALKAIADVSTAMHRDMREVASAIVTTETEPLRNLGIMLDRTGKKAVLSSNGVRMEVNKDIDSIRAGIIELMSKSMGGAMDDAKKTWSGALSTMGGMWKNFKMDVMGEGKNTGPFQTLKDQINAVNSEWEKFTKTQEYRQLISDIQEGLVTAIKMTVEAVKSLGKVLQTAKGHLAELKGLFMTIVSIKFTGWAIGVLKSIRSVSTYIGTLSATLTAFETAHPWLFVASMTGAAAAGFYKLAKDRMASLADENKMREDLGERAPKMPASRKGKEWRQYKKDLTAAWDKYIGDPLAASDAREDARLNGIANRKSISVTIPSAGAGTAASGKAKSGGGSSGRSAVETLVEGIRDQIRYMNADGESFLPVLEKWLSKTKVLSGDWKTLKDLYSEITAAAEERNPFAPEKVLERLKEAKERMASLREEAARLRQAFYDTFSWQHDMGLISDAEHLEKLRENFARLKEEYISTGAAIENYQLWPQELRDAYAALQQGIVSGAQPAMEMLDKQFQEGTLTLGEYTEALRALMLQYGETPLLTKQISEHIKAAEASTLSFRESVRAMLADAQKSFEGLAASVTGGLADSFARAIAYSENLGDALKKLGQDIIYTVTKMLLLKQISSWLGIGKSAVSSVVDIPGPRGVAAYAGLHSGGVVGKEATFTRRLSALPRFHTGGIIGQDERLIIARKGEGVFTKEQMKALGGVGSSVFAPSITVNVTNNGSGEMNNEQAQQIGQSIRD